jgi:DNA-binding NtrC family response regulator
MLMPLEQLSRLHIRNVVAKTGGDVPHAAALLGIGSAKLQLKLSRHHAH